MRRMAQSVIDDFDELLLELSREQGRTRGEVAALELLAAIDALMWIAQDGEDTLGGRRVGISRSMSPVKRARIAYEPYGVVGVIGAGSAPFAQPLGQIAGALLAGNAVVFKPAARACLAGERIARILARAGLPEGLVRIAHGGPDVGIALAQSRAEKILFTGSPAVGRVVARACVSREKEVTVELGGKDAMLVLADAHLNRGGRRRAVGGMRGRGTGARSGRADLRRTRGLRAVPVRTAQRRTRDERRGSRRPPDTGGSAASERRVAHVSSLVEEAVRAGASLHCGGPVSPGGAAAGSFYAPAVLTGVQRRTCGSCASRSTARCMTVVPVDCGRAGDRGSRTHASFGLGASVWTARPLPAAYGSPASCARAWSGSTTTCRGRRSHAGRGAPAPAADSAACSAQAGLRACAQEKLITWEPAGAAGAVVGPCTTGRTRTAAARAVAQLRSGRESDRERAWRQERWRWRGW